MKLTLTKNIVFSGVMLLLVMNLSQCTSSTFPEWEEKNKELIKQHNLTGRELSGRKCDNYLKSNWAKLYRLFLHTGQVCPPGYSLYV